MINSRFCEETVDFLSRITGKKLSQRDVTPPVIFLGSLVTLLLDVIFIDVKVAEEEKQRLLTTLYRFSSPDSNVRKLTHLMIKGIREEQAYRKIDDILALTASLTESQRLLLISFGYEMSAADGYMDSREKKYLEKIASRLDIQPQHLETLEVAFINQENLDLAALKEVRFLLEHLRFQELDTVFVLAARDMLDILPVLPEKKSTQKSVAISYDQLNKFKERYQKLDEICNHTLQITQDCSEKSFLPDTLIKKVKKVSEKIQSQRFRVAVIGEFSQGKSTLLNALLGEEIQPAREIPCSATVTVLKYGEEKRVTCRYKDGREEEINFDEYQEKASISEDAAIDCLSNELSKSDIEEIIFEHPDLELCKSGVEIVDSPGLNEHPERTAITQQILRDIDAAIFLTNASRALTQEEQRLLHDTKTKLNGGDDSQPAENLFIIGNFMDLVRTEKGKEQVKKRIENFVQGNKPIITGENRVHFISAQATLDAIKNGSENEYLKTFDDFIRSLSHFLTSERGDLKIRSSVIKVENILQDCFEKLKQAENTLEGKIQISENDKQKIIEQIGEASGRDTKICNIATQLMDEVWEEVIESFGEWHENIVERIVDCSYKWNSEHSPVWDQEELIKDYTNCFIQDLYHEIDEWGNKEVKEVILKKYLQILDTNIEYELDAIQTTLNNLDINVNAFFSNNLDVYINTIDDDFTGSGGMGGGLGIGVVAAGLLAFTGVGFIAMIVTSVAAGVLGSFGLGMFDVDGLHDKIKIKIIEEGFEKFGESIDDFNDKLDEIISTVFESRVESASNVITQAISNYENLLEQ
ncbi:MAG: dynamin family protein [Cyanobacteria bacterium P01_A01_bin.84]